MKPLKGIFRNSTNCSADKGAPCPPKLEERRRKRRVRGSFLPDTLRLVRATKAIIFIGLAIPVLSYAPITQADQDTQLLLAGYGTDKEVRELVTKLPEDKYTIQWSNWAQDLHFPYPTNPLAIELTELDLLKFFTTAVQLPEDKNLENNQASFGPPGAGLPQNNIFRPPSAQNNEEKLKQTTPFANVDLNSVLGPLYYNDKQKESAANFIRAVGSLNNPMQIVDLVAMGRNLNPPLTAAALAANDKKTIEYLTSLRLYAAMQSVGISNLYQLYAERVPSQVPASTPAVGAIGAISSSTQNPRTKQLYEALTNLKLPNSPNLSQLQVENYMATRRLTDATWLANLTKDSPAALMRQIVILLAENLAESYNNRMATERLTATMSVIALQQAQAMRVQLDESAKNLTAPPPPPPTP